MKKMIVAVGMALMMGHSAQAADVYTFDKTHTSILFFINHAGFSDMVGEFHDYDGTLTLDEEKPENSKVEVTIRPASADTDVKKLDAKLQKDDFFNVGKHPEATFKSTKVVKTSDTTADVTGDFTMLGVTKPLTLNVTLNKIGDNRWSGKKVAGFRADGVIKRSDWGMTYLVPDIGDEVRLLIQAEFNK